RQRRQYRRSVRVDPAGIWGLSSDRCGPFFLGVFLGVFLGACRAVTPCPGAVKRGHFFAADGWAHVISPPARGIAAGYGCYHPGGAELVDALDLGSSDESCGGSSPSARTKRLQRLHDELLEGL